MLNLTANENGVHARIEGVDLSGTLSVADRKTIEQALAEYGVVSFPAQSLTAVQLRDLGATLGPLEVNVANLSSKSNYCEKDIPEVMILSNIVENGRPIGLPDAGQDWHTDLSYNSNVDVLTILYGLEIPHRDGVPLGCTEFVNTRRAYDDLADEIKASLESTTVLHDFNKLWEKLRKKGGYARPPLSDEQRRAKPPVSHPLFLSHPLTGNKVIYVNPGYSMRINELPKEESDRLLEMLFAHVLQPKYRYRHAWTPGDVLIWDNVTTMHTAIADYLPHERRLMKRCQVILNRFATEIAVHHA